MIRIMTSIRPSDMTVSPESGRRMKIRRPARGNKAYPGLWFHRRNRTGLFRLQFQRRRIDAVTQTSGTGTVLEDGAEMAVALRAQYLGPHHAVADVAFLVDMAVHGRRREARPAASGIELGVGFEQ